MVKRFGVSLDNDLLDALDEYVKSNNFSNRSQAIRSLVEKGIAEQKWLCNHIVAGSVVVIYDQNRSEVTRQIMQIEKSGRDLILATSTFFVKDSMCMVNISIKGEAVKLTELADKLRAVKGIQHSKLLMSRAD